MMIVRSTVRRRRSNLLAASFAQLTLPWLAPAQLRWVASHNTAPALSTHRPRKRSTGQERRDSASLRRLATSADTIRQTLGTPYDGTLLSGKQDPEWGWHDPALRGGYMRELGSTIVLDTASRTRPGTLLPKNGISGSVADLLQHLHVNLRVGRLPRARKIVERLQQEAIVTASELAYAHAAYLEGLLNAVRAHAAGSNDAQEAFDEMQKWFEGEIHMKDVSVSGQMLVHMVSASIHATTGTERDMAIDRYVQIGSEIDEDVHDEVLFSDEYDDEEFEILSRVTDTTPLDEEVQLAQHSESAEHLTEQVRPRQHYRRPDAVFDDMPEVTETVLTGTGLADIKKTLRPLRDTPALPADAPIEEQRAVALNRQRLMEEKSIEVAIEKWRAADAELRKLGINTALQARSVSALMWQWYSKLLPVIQEEMNQCRQALKGTPRGQPTPSGSAERVAIGPYLELLPAETWAASTIVYVLAHLTRGKHHEIEGWEVEYKVANVLEHLGKHLELECRAHAASKGHKGSKSQGTRLRQSRKGKYVKAGRTTRGNYQQIQESTTTWTTSTRARIGAVFLDRLVQTAQIPVTREHVRTKEKVTQLQPAFNHRTKWSKGRRLGTIAPSAELLHKLESEPLGGLLAKRMPMVVEPKPWNGWRGGGYLNYDHTIMRAPPGASGCQEYFAAAHNQGDLEQVYAGLNALSKVPWLINHDVLRVQVEAWNSGEAVGNFAPLHPKLDIPPEPEPSADPQPRRKWLQTVRDMENRKAGFHSQRSFQNFQLETARTMANDTIYLPHNLDFRGRAYPIPPYLNHMGADNVRSLLVFADGKELGESGLRWLKIHLANTAGYDKASLEEREEFAMKHLDDIRDSVNNPLGGRQWWRESEDAWQTLAACFELVHALDSPDPSKFVSHLPVQQDGTCNGLQHYAALGGDRAGAVHVNLEPGERPADVYTAVANGVKEHIDRDAATGHPIAKLLQGRISRKIVKQPVMTNVYGVTHYGARAQIKKQLIDLLPDVRRGDDINHLDMAIYITDKVFLSLGSLFTGAQAIQNWLGQCADRIASCITAEQIAQLASGETTASPKSTASRREEQFDKDYKAASLGKRDMILRRSFKNLFKSTVVWTSPLGLPVVQPYRSSSTTIISSSLQNVMLAEPRIWDPVTRRKQLQAFPPNFIHSLDATHMLLSASKCNEAGITFASIHDSFWTHACDVGHMGTVLRDAFVAMHSDDIIGRLHEELETRYKNGLYMVEVAGATPTAEKITAWRQANPQHTETRFSELHLEAARMKLLRSSDEAERRRGEEMVTPASIVESEGQPDVEVMHRLLQEQTVAAMSTGGEPGDAQEQETLRKRKAKSATLRVTVWRPMCFPPVPEKGDFDVTRLRESKYFFS